MIDNILSKLYSLAQFWWIALLSVLFIFGIVLIVPVLLITLPADYFAEKERNGIIKNFIFPFNLIILALKNSVGFIFVFLGVILLFIPGQGLLTIFTGLMLLNFPGKRRLELYIIRKKSVLNAINWLRDKSGKEKIINIYGRE